MKNLFILAFIVMTAQCCRQEPIFFIHGTLPSNQYDGEWVYLVPFEKHTAADVDSAKVEGGKFLLSGIVERIAILRTRPVLRLRFQELLVVTEKGHINVVLDSIGSTSGTPQNDALQAWKESRENFMRQRAKLHRMKKKGEGNADSLQMQMDSLSVADENFNYDFLKSQGNTRIGSLIRTLVSLNPEHKTEIDSILENNK